MSSYGSAGNKMPLRTLLTLTDTVLSYQSRRPSLSQHVTELAQRVDFSEVAEGRDGEPAVKKAMQKWPWEQPHSKLKYTSTVYTFHYL